MNALDPQPVARPRPPSVRFFSVVVEARSYGNLLFLLLSFPLGLVYFVFLSVGISLGLGLVIVWIGIPLLALVLLVSRGLVLLERWLATYLLGAALPPAGPDADAQPSAPPGVARQVISFLSNPVTWKGLAYLGLKLPLGVVTFCLCVTLLALSAGFLATPFLYGEFDIRFGPWWIDTLPQALAVAAFGLLLGLLSLHACNAMAWLWRQLAIGLLGSRRFAALPAAAREAAAA
ncbi:MAG TPA: sensor domain-containing protein [Thermoanaerobaculia bacterium]|nr:sensor domain-containing protein [Thermoanaerobaculia bacterium]